MSIKTHEREIIGNWFLYKGKVVADDHCKRVDKLVRDYLSYIKTDETGWDKLYQDPVNGRYWEKTHLKSETHGGGPPSLIYISNEKAHSKYNIQDT